MTDTTSDPRHQHHEEGFPAQQQDQPGHTERTEPTPDHGESSYRGHGRLAARKALITGGDSGIGRAAAIAFAREGADVALSYLPAEEEDAQRVCSLIRDAGRRAVALPGDLARGAGVLVDVLNPQAIVLGGFFGAFADVLVQPVQEALDARLLPPDGRVEVSASALGLDAAAIGGADMALERVLADPLLAPVLPAGASR